MPRAATASFDAGRAAIAGGGVLAAGTGSNRTEQKAASREDPAAVGISAGVQCPAEVNTPIASNAGWEAVHPPGQVTPLPYGASRLLIIPDHHAGMGAEQIARSANGIASTSGMPDQHQIKWGTGTGGQDELFPGQPATRHY